MKTYQFKSLVYFLCFTISCFTYYTMNKNSEDSDERKMVHVEMAPNEIHVLDNTP